MSVKFEGKPPFYLRLAEGLSAHALHGSVVLRAIISTLACEPGPAAMSAKISASAKAFQQTLVSAEADEVVDRSLIPFRQVRSAAGRTLQPTELGPPRGQPLGHFFATWREQARPW